VCRRAFKEEESMEIKGILINAKIRTVSYVTLDQGDIGKMQKLIGCDIFTTVRVDRTNTAYVDDMGLLNGTRHFFKANFYETPLAGNCLILGNDPSGESVDTTLTLEDVKVKYLERADVQRQSSNSVFN
jgi:hypothetical protein